MRNNRILGIIIMTLSIFGGLLMMPSLGEKKNIDKIYLAGGCFWGVQSYFSKLPGVVYTEVGYANGNTKNPTYEEVLVGDTNFAETVLVKYDANKISLAEILDNYFDVVDVTTLNRQSHDSGAQYRSGIYYLKDSDREIIEKAIKQEQKKHKEPIVTEIKKLENFYIAEEYHQKYLDKNPGGYCHIDISKFK